MIENTMIRIRPSFWIWALLCTGVLTSFESRSFASEPEPRWWKGNLHTHSLWSDGNDYPEMIADWYRSHGYQFLAFTD